MLEPGASDSEGPIAPGMSSLSQIRAFIQIYSPPCRRDVRGMVGRIDFHGKGLVQALVQGSFAVSAGEEDKFVGLSISGVVAI
jgi:hypothetical protein